MKMCVSGGYGFLGTYVVQDLIDEGHDIWSFDIAPESAVDPDLDVTDAQGDITDPIDRYDALSLFNPTASCISSRYSPQCVNSIHGGIRRERDRDGERARSCLDARRRSGNRCLQRRRLWLDSGRYDRLDESVPRNPESLYGQTKYNIERPGETFGDKNEFSFAALELVYTNGTDRRTGYTPVA